MSSHSLEQPPSGERAGPSRAALIIGGLMLLAVVLALVSIIGSRNGLGGNYTAPSPVTVFVLVLPAYLAGLLSFLSPCCLPVLSAYFAYAVQIQRERLLMMTFAFFLGIATTMVALGASATALSQILFRSLPLLTTVGGIVVIVFGVLSLLGKGFSGVQIGGRADASVAGAYAYGATFALGWTACVGPILGALLTMLATQGLGVLQGASLSFVYAVGLGTPLLLLALALRRSDGKARVWRALRGRSIRLNLGVTTIETHTISVISGLLLITMGVLLATGQMAVLSQYALRTPLSRWVLDVEEWMRVILLGS